MKILQGHVPPVPPGSATSVYDLRRSADQNVSIKVCSFNSTTRKFHQQYLFILATPQLQFVLCREIDNFQCFYYLLFSQPRVVCPKTNLCAYSCEIYALLQFRLSKYFPVKVIGTAFLVQVALVSLCYDCFVHLVSDMLKTFHCGNCLAVLGNKRVDLLIVPLDVHVQCTCVSHYKCVHLSCVYSVHEISDRMSSPSINFPN